MTYEDIYVIYIFSLQTMQGDDRMSRWLLTAVVVFTMLSAGCGGDSSQQEVGVRIERFNTPTSTFDQVAGSTATEGLFAISDTERTYGTVVELVSGNGSRVPSQPRSFTMLPGQATFKVTIPDGRSAVRTILIVEDTTSAETLSALALF